MILSKAVLFSALAMFLATASATRSSAPEPAQGANSAESKVQAGATKPWDLKAPAPLPDGRASEVEGWKDISCTRCHEAIAKEWAGSLHAIAWVDERFQEQIADMKRPEGCHGCHAPEPLVPLAVDGELPQKPKARDLAPQSGAQRELDVHFGVTCVSCHAGAKGEMLGPFGAPTSAHESAKSDLFLESSNSKLCIACHATTVGPVIGIAKDFVDTDQAAKQRSCVGCHMQAIERSIATDEAKKPLAARAGRSHALQSPRDPAFLKRAFGFEAKTRDGAVVVFVKNECGHRVPGLSAQRIALDAEMFDASGKSVSKGELVIEKRASLPIDGALEIPLAGSGVRVVVKGTFDTPGFEQPASFLDVTLAIAP